MINVPQFQHLRSAVGVLDDGLHRDSPPHSGGCEPVLVPSSRLRSRRSS
jgi:hypothetical protein